MTDLEQVADGLHRTAKLALDTGEAASIDDAMRIFSGYQDQQNQWVNASVHEQLL